MVTDTNSPKEDINKINNILDRSNIESRFISINLENFKDKIKSGYSDAKFANMANFYTSLMIAKKEMLI